ncbi:hypothetical protein V8F33_006480 [Rhypophila sp. PSN 637]
MQSAATLFWKHPDQAPFRPCMLLGRLPAATYISIHLPYCKRHRCQSTIGGPCPQVADTPSRFCEQHKCPVPGCKRSCLDAVKYCDHHRCYWDDRECPQENSWRQKGWYCPNHTCSVARCFEATLPDRHQCDARTCVGADDGVRCGVEVNHGGGRGSQHCCLERNCYNVRDGEGGYCAEHVCASPDGCYERRGARGRYCEYHMAEYLQQTGVVATRSSRGVTRSQPTRNNMQDYGAGYLDGLQVGINVPGGDREYARRAMEQLVRDSGHDGERAQWRQEMAGLAGLVIQREIEGDGVAAPWGQPRLIEEVQEGQQQTLGDLIYRREQS